MERVPLGPFTDKVRPSRLAVTPLGTGTGLLPMRLILEHLRQHFASDILLARFRGGQNATRRRNDGHAKAVADPRQLGCARIDPATGLRDAREMLDSRLALEIFEFDPQAL